MPKVEQGVPTSEGLHFKRELSDDAHAAIVDEIFSKREGDIASWSEVKNDGRLLKLSMGYTESVLPPRSIIFSFTSGTQSYKYENIHFNPDKGPTFDIDPRDVAAYFIVAQKALSDGVTAENVFWAFTKVFATFRSDENGDSKKFALAKELTASKYLP